MQKEEYLEYLKSPEWAVRRDMLIKAADGRCQLCNSPDGLQVHHRRYTNVGNEHPADLVVLCRKCHEKHHGKDQKIKMLSFSCADKFLNFASIKRFLLLFKPGRVLCAEFIVITDGLVERVHLCSSSSRNGIEVSKDSLQ